MEIHTSPIQKTLCQRTPPMRENTSLQSLKEKQEPQHQGCGGKNEMGIFTRGFFEFVVRLNLRVISFSPSKKLK